MSYRVINCTTGEIVAEFGPRQFDLAKELADRLAEDVDHQQQLVVVELVTVYEAPVKGGAP